MRVSVPRADGASKPLSRRSGTPVRRILLLGLVIYGLSVPLVNLVLIPESIRASIFNYRPYAFTLYIAIAVVMMAATGLLHPMHRFDKHGLGPAMVMAGSFPFGYGLIKVAKGVPTFDLIVLHGLWVVAAFFVMPLVIWSKPTVNALAKAITALAVVGTAATMILSTRASAADVVAVLHLSSTRQSYGFLNPNFFAQLPQLVIASAGYLLAGSSLGRGWPRVAAWGAIAASLLLILDSRSRNVMAFILVVGWVYLVLLRRVFSALLIFGVVIVYLLLAPISVDTAAVDRLSSGRSVLWQQTIAASFDNANPVVALLGGPIEQPEVEVTAARYEPLINEREFNRYHVDNAYLGLFVEVGLVGLLWFLVPYVVIARRLAMTKRPENRYVVAVLAGVAAQSMFAATVPTIGSPLGFLMLLWMVAVPLALLDDSAIGLTTPTSKTPPSRRPPLILDKGIDSLDRETSLST